MPIWGYDGVPHGDLRWWDGDSAENQLRWCATNGFRCTGHMKPATWEDPDRRARLIALARDLGLRVHLGFNLDWWTLPMSEIHAKGEAFVAGLDGFAGLDVPFIGTGLGQTHRYHPTRPLERQLDHVSSCLAPLARRLAERGTPLALHNGFDWAGAELAELCRRTPGLGLLYDTGNVMVLGLDPLESARAAAPHVIATHLKDHVVYPWTDERAKAEGVKRQAFLVDGAALGEGHGRVLEVMHAIHAGHPAPERIIWGWEVEPAKDDNGQSAVDRSWAVCRRFEREIA